MKYIFIYIAKDCKLESFFVFTYVVGQNKVYTLVYNIFWLVASSKSCIVG